MQAVGVIGASAFGMRCIRRYYSSQTVVDPELTEVFNELSEIGVWDPKMKWVRQQFSDSGVLRQVGIEMKLREKLRDAKERVIQQGLPSREIVEMERMLRHGMLVRLTANEANAILKSGGVDEDIFNGFASFTVPPLLRYVSEIDNRNDACGGFPNALTSGHEAEYYK